MDLTYTGHDSSVWRLAGSHEGLDGVLAERVEGFIAEVTVHTEPGARSAGVRVVGIDIDEMTGVIGFKVGPDFVPAVESFGDDADAMDALYRRWRAAWSLNPARPGRLTFHAPGKAALTTSARAAALPGPAESADSPVAVWLEGEVEVVCDDGVWFAPDEVVLAGVEWWNRGELPVWPTITWQGSGASFTPPGLSAPIALPSASQPLVLDTDPATGCRVTVGDKDGPVAWAQWRAMRGARAPRPIMPGGTSAGWSVTRAELRCQARVIDPWAW